MSFRFLIVVILFLITSHFFLFSADKYVWSAAPSSASPYESWNTAATNIWDAVNAASAGETIWVTNGTYGLTNPIVIGKAITLRSVNGKNVTIINRGTASQIRLLILSNASAVVDGFTFTNGYGRANTTNTATYPGSVGHSYGGAVRIYNGTIRNCRIVKSTCMAGIVSPQHSINGYGGGIYMATGLIENCEVLNNTATGTGSDSAYGGGIYMLSGRIISCVITGNVAQGTGNGEGHGGGVWMAGNGVLLSSFLHGNRATAANNVAPSYGGGIYLGGNGVVSNCVILRNRCNFWESIGGGVWMNAGLVTHCHIISNRCEVPSGHSYATSQYAGGAGTWMSGGTLRNCVIARNVCVHSGQIRNGATRGAGVLMTGGQIEHCTISRNIVDKYGRGAGIFMTGGQVWNSIIYYNFDDISVSYTEDHENLYQVGGTVNKSCTTNAYGLTGSGNTGGEPCFAYRWTNDFRLLLGSSCIDAGSNLVNVVSDISGNVRPIDGDGDGNAFSDIGAYEAVGKSESSFRCGFRSVPDTIIGNGGSVVFNGYVGGTNTAGVVYRWDLQNDGTWDYVGGSYAVITGNYVYASNYTVKLTASNALGQVYTATKPAAVRIFPPVVYSRPVGSGIPVFPYNTWQKAATNLQTAMDTAIAGTTVLLSNGVYEVSIPFCIRRALTVTSLNGHKYTFIQRKSGVNTRLGLVTHPSAILEKVTLRNGSWSISGMALGGAIWMTAGMIRDCAITNNLASGLPNQPGYGGGIYMSDGILRNCFLYKNESRSGNNYAHGGGVYISGGLIENCTIVSNYSQRTDATGANSMYALGGGVRLEGGRMTNSVVVYNGVRGPTNRWRNISFASGSAGYCCSPDVTHDPTGTGNITNSPVFTDVSKADYTLTPNSSCVDAGTNKLWMINNFDLNGIPRIQSVSKPRVDIGAYEVRGKSGGVFMFL